MSTAAGRCCWAGSPRDGALVTMTGGLAHGDGDIRVILAAQALRAAAYGFAAVLLGVGAASRAFGLTDRLWLLGLVALLGVLSTEVVESGPFTSLEQAMLAEAAPQPAAPRVFARYNAVATLAGSLGALGAGLAAAGPGPGLLRLRGTATATAMVDWRWFVLLVPVGVAGAALAGRLLGQGRGAGAPSGLVCARWAASSAAAGALAPRRAGAVRVVRGRRARRRVRGAELPRLLAA